MLRTFRRHYGAHPLHLLALVACFALAGYAALKLVADQPVAVVVWFVGAAVAHDVVLVPLYAIVDGRIRRASGSRAATVPRAPWLNYVRFPAAISGLLLLMFFPEILRINSGYSSITGLSGSGFVVHWLAITGVLFLISAVAYAVRLRRSR